MGHATVDAELDARDIATVVGRQEDDGLRDLVRRVNAPEWNFRRHLNGELPHLLIAHPQTDVVTFRRNHAGADRIYADLAML